jgi:NAD(P)H-dependent FMN reductase
MPGSSGAATSAPAVAHRSGDGLLVGRRGRGTRIGRAQAVPASLKNAIDHIFPEFHRKPLMCVGYGNVGGARAIEQLRLVSVELEMAPLRHAIHILPELMVPAMNADPFDPEIFAPLDGKLDVAISDLVWWASTLAGARAASPRL